MRFENGVKLKIFAAGPHLFIFAAWAGLFLVRLALFAGDRIRFATLLALEH